MTLSEIISATALPKSTVYKILYTLAEEDGVKKEKDRFFLGSILIHYGLKTLSERDLVKTSAPYLTKLMEETGETTHLTVPADRQSLILNVVQTAHPIRFASSVGSLFPLYCTSHGKVILAHTKDFTLDEYLTATPLIGKTAHTIRDRKNLEKELETIRKQGYSMDELEYADDIRCCAAGIFGSTGELLGVLGITATTITFVRERIEEVSRAVMRTAGEISREMGAP